MRISRAKARGTKLIVIDPRKASVVDKADLWLRVRPGSDGALALAMIHVLLEEGLYDAAFVRDWTNGPFLVREDTQQLLTERDLAPAGHPETFCAWDSKSVAPVAYRPDHGYRQDGVDPALSGTYAFTLADGKTVQCRPSLALLKDLVAQYAPERSEALTWVPAADVRRAVRMFAIEQPSCYYTWVGLEEHTNATQTSRAVAWAGLLYGATVGMVMAMALWGKSIHRLGPQQTMLYAYLEPVSAVLIAAVGLGEALHPLQAVGALLTFVGVGLASGQ